MPRVSADMRRKELVDATIALALREGLAVATVRRIADEAGVSLGTVHYCFGSKQALLEAVVDTISEPRLQIEVPEHATAPQLIELAFEAYWREAGSNRERQQLLYELTSYLVREPERGPELARKIYQRAWGVVERFIEQYAGQFEVELPADPETIARVVVAVTDGVALAWIADGDDEAAQRVLRTVSAILGVALATPVHA